MEPVRIQRKRTRGWKMPENTVYVGRPTIWGNPYSVVRDVGGRGWAVFFEGHSIGVCFAFKSSANKYAVDKFMAKVNAMQKDMREDFLAGLRGKNLACWCGENVQCHADVLLSLANDERTS